MGRPVLITGGEGMLGTALRRVLAQHGIRFVAPELDELDITSPEDVSKALVAFAETEPHGFVVNAAAYTNVELAEDEPDVAYAVNEDGARILAAEASRHDLGFVHVSTDFVFDGLKKAPYVEDDAPDPLSVYGSSKLAGEIAVRDACPEALIVRTAWLFGENGDNFPAKILRAARSGRSLRVVTDEVGSPTYTVDLAAGILDLIDRGASGIYHLTGSGSCTRFEFSEEVLAMAGLVTRVDPVRSDAFPTKARRPANSVLDCTKAASLGVVLPEWPDALRRFITGSDREGMTR